MQKKSNINIYDIAKQAGVSIATVSRVLNNSQNVNQNTREKVLQVIENASFTPNSFARGLGLGTMRMVGILCTDVADLYYSAAVASIERLLRENGLNAMLCCTGNKIEDKKTAMSILLSKKVDAIILVGSAFKEQSDNSHIEQAAKQVPVIIVNGLVECESTYCVLCEESEAMRENVLRLYEKGCRDILYIYDTKSYSGTQKLEGYHLGHEQLKIPVNEKLILNTQKSVDIVTEQVAEILSSGQNVDAVLASEDILAIGALKAISQQERKIPIIGFNNSILAECSSPALTSVDNMVETLCTIAVNELCELLDGKTPPMRVKIAARLVERDTFRIN